jgi:NAD(P)-dependent dehydrogenase (short-subunit alcohol dehydrogenase family)
VVERLARDGATVIFGYRADEDAAEEVAAGVIAAGGRPVAGISLYAASKGAVEQLTVIAADQLGERGITVNTVSPGATETDMLSDDNSPEGMEMMRGMSPLGRLGQPRGCRGRDRVPRRPRRPVDGPPRISDPAAAFAKGRPITDQHRPPSRERSCLVSMVDDPGADRAKIVNVAQT